MATVSGSQSELLLCGGCSGAAAAPTEQSGWQEVGSRGCSVLAPIMAGCKAGMSLLGHCALTGWLSCLTWEQLC